MEQRQDQPSENWPCGRTTGTEVRPRVYCVCGTPPPQRLPPGTTRRPRGLGVPPHPPLCWGICSCFVCSQQLGCLDLLSLLWCGTAAGAAPLPWPPSVSGVFKDGGGSHASPDAHGHHPVGPGEGDTQVGWRLGHQALAGKAELGAPGPRGRQTSACGPQPAPQARTQGDRCLLQARIPRLLSLEHVGVRTPPPDAPTGLASPLPAALQLVEQRDNLSSPRAAQRVAQGHCTPQRVHLLKGEFQLLHTVHSLGGGGASAVDPSLVPFAPRPLAPTGGPRPHCKTKAHLTSKGLVDLKDVHVIHGQPCRPGGKT